MGQDGTQYRELAFSIGCPIKTKGEQALNKSQQYAADAAYSVESERDGHDGMRAVRREWNSISIARRRWQWGPPMLG